MHATATILARTFAVLMLFLISILPAPAAQAGAPVIAWKSFTTSECAGPVDANGRHWYEPQFDDTGWVVTELPDQAIPAGQTRFYRARFTAPGPIPQATLQVGARGGSQGYVNGNHIGRWGSDCRADPPSDGAAEVDLTPNLAAGVNVLALQADGGPEGGSLAATIRAGGGKVWTRYRGNPVVDVRLSGNWDAAKVSDPAVLKEAGAYRMWYAGAGERPQIGLALSGDGITWRAFGDRPVLGVGEAGRWDSAAVTEPTVLLAPDGYRMYYAGADGSAWRIGLATSPDGVTWTKRDAPVLEPGAAGAFDAGGPRSPHVYFDGSRYRLWYVATDGVTSETRLGLAYSRDGLHWYKTARNPVLEGDFVGPNAGIDAPTVVAREGRLEMWFAAGNALHRAVSGDGINWGKPAAAPALAPGNASAWDSRQVGGASVLFDGARYAMWYTGNGERIGFASSADGLAWQKRPSAVLEQPEGFGPEEEWTLGRATILPETGGYRMWYSGYHRGWLIQTATSPDGITWERPERNVALLPGPDRWDSVEVFSPRVLRSAQTGLLQMWYTGWDSSGSYRIGHALSTDNGATWNKSAANPVLNLGKPGAWDSLSVQGASVVEEPGGYRMWYMGQDGNTWQIGMATSPDGDAWTRYAGNPVMQPGPTDAWDGRHLFWLHVIEGGPGYQMWYSGTNDAWGLGPIRIGYAESRDGIHWNRDAQNPVSIPKPAGWWGQSDSMEPYVIREGDVYRMWFTERNEPRLYRLNYAWSAVTPAEPLPPAHQLYLPLMRLDE
jgi:predicted GH43/DUF377 family glycosyl hydrolase